MAEVVIFVDQAAWEGHISTDPYSYQIGHYNMVQRFVYDPMLSGDLEKAQSEAQKFLENYLRVDAVAVFYNRPTGEARFEDSPTGNYKGSGQHPYSFVTEFEYDRNDPQSHQEALRKAQEEVAYLES